MLYGGVIADRVPRRKLLIVTQALSMFLAFVLAALTFTNVVAPWHIIVLAFCLGVVNAFDAPARQSFVLEMVDRNVLTNAIALNSTMFNMAVAIGPAIGGLTYALFGPGLVLHDQRPVLRGGDCRAGGHEAGAEDPAAGEKIGVRRDPGRPGRRGRRPAHPRHHLLLAALSLFGMSFAVLMPAWAVQVLGGDARTNGFLQSARGIGALLAALGIASLAHRRFKGKLVTAASFALPVALLLFSLTRTAAPIPAHAPCRRVDEHRREQSRQRAGAGPGP